MPSNENNTPFRKRISKKTWRNATILGAVILVLIVYVIWDVAAGGPLTSLFSNRDKLIEIINRAGIFAPLIYICLQILQTVLAPIPSSLIGSIGGFLFGWWGVLWTVIGTGIGCGLVFAISRKFGRPLVEKFVKKESLDKFDFVMGDNATFILFVIFLIPGLPDDIVCYLAGLTEIPIKKLIAMVCLGRLPAIVASNYLGAGLESGNFQVLAVGTVVIVLILAVCVWQKDRIIGYLKSKSTPKPEE